MGLEFNHEEHYRIVDKYGDPVVNYNMTTRDYVLRPSANNLTGAIQITLPPVADARGKFYSIVARDADGTNTITITDRDDSECWLADITLSAKCHKVLLYSDGLCWHPLNDVGDFPGVATTIAPATADPTTLAPTTERDQSTTLAPTTLATTTAPTTLATTVAPTTVAG